MRKVRFPGLYVMLLESETLLELSVEMLLWEPCWLRVRAPRLRVLRMVLCRLVVFKLAAPMLEELLFLDGKQSTNINIDHGELSCIRRLKVELVAHAYPN